MSTDLVRANQQQTRNLVGDWEYFVSDTTRTIAGFKPLLNP